MADVRFRLDRRLHAGQWSSVYLATQVELDRQVVVKFFHCDEQEAMSTLRREVGTLCKLRHPNNVQVVDTGGAMEGGQRKPFVAMEYVPGSTLRQVLRKERRLNALRVWRVALQVLAALTEAHEAGIVHRDVKPENLMLWKPAGLEEHVKVIDYGLARNLVRSSSTVSSLDGLAAGTPHYMAPEVAQGKPATPASDLYGLGVVMYECLAGQRPFDASEPMSVLFQQVHVQPAPIRGVVPVPEDLAEIVHKALQKDPAARFQTAQEFQKALHGLAFRKLARYQLAEFDPIGFEEAIETDVFEPSAWEAASGLVGEMDDEIPSDIYAPVRANDATDTSLRSTDQPSVWVLGEDPAIGNATVVSAVETLGQSYDVWMLSSSEREEAIRQLLDGVVRPPNVLVFGDMHVLLQEALLTRLRGQTDVCRLLVSTHLNPEMMQTTVNFVGLDQHVSLPTEPEVLVAAIEKMIGRSRAIHHHQDQLRLALRDARTDVQRLARAAQHAPRSTFTPQELSA